MFISGAQKLKKRSRNSHLYLVLLKRLDHTFDHFFYCQSASASETLEMQRMFFRSAGCFVSLNCLQNAGLQLVGVTDVRKVEGLLTPPSPACRQLLFQVFLTETLILELIYLELILVASLN